MEQKTKIKPTFQPEEIDRLKESMSEVGSDGELYEKPERL